MIWKLDTKAETEAASTLPDAEWVLGFPHVTEYLCSREFEDGSARLPSTITLFVEQGLCKAALNDKNSGASLYRSAYTFVAAVSELEQALSAKGTADWRAWKKFKK